MRSNKKKGIKKGIFLISLMLIAAFALVGCSKRSLEMGWLDEPAPVIDEQTTIGSLVEVFSVDAIAVEGYGLVGGLGGTGSSECPPDIRSYLKQYILGKLSKGKLNPDEFISSKDTAVVLIYGLMPMVVSGDRYFDIRVNALPGTGTTSLAGGWLYGSELNMAGRFGTTGKVLASAEGPVFIDTLGSAVTSKRGGYVLAGGVVLDKYRINLSVRVPNYRTTALIRSRINERFGKDTAEAVSPSLLKLTVPPKYRNQKKRFISTVRAIHILRDSQITRQRITEFVRKLAVSQDKQASEIALETIGNQSIGKLSALLNSSQPEVRFRAARCMLNLGSDKGLSHLRRIALDKDSAYRIEALDAVVAAARYNDAMALARRLLRNDDFNMQLAAYEKLRALDDVAIEQTLIGRKFYLEEITQTDRKSIFVSRSGQPRIVLFGAPLVCKSDIFIQSPDGNITINAQAGDKYVSIMRKVPGTSGAIAKFKSSFELGDIIRVLCSEPADKRSQNYPGLNVSYADTIAILKQMCEKGALQAEFHVGSLPKVGRIVKK